MSRASDNAHLLAALRTARAVEDQAKLNALAPPQEPKGPRHRFLRFCERLLGIR